MYNKFWMGLMLSVASLTGHAELQTCPDPQVSPFKWGIPPKPWEVNPFSDAPQVDKNTQFARANILVAGLGQGVICTYKNSLNSFSIWWPVRVKIPAALDYYWVETLQGFACNESITACQFSVVRE